MNKTLWVCLFVVSSLPFPATVLAGVGVSPSSISFGSVPVNTVSSAATIMLTNNSNQGVTISSISSSLPEFVVGGISTPFSLAARSSVAVLVYFQPDSAATFTGNIVVNGIKHGWGSASVSVYGTGVSAVSSSTTGSLLSVSTGSLTFSNTLVGTSGSLPFTIANSGTTTINISQLAASGTSFSVSGFSGSASLSPGQTLSLAAVFSPTTTGPATGAISMVSNASNSPSTISLSGVAVQPQVTVVPTSVSFGNVTVGVTNSQTITIQNPGTAGLSVSQAAVSGSGF